MKTPPRNVSVVKLALFFPFASNLSKKLGITLAGVLALTLTSVHADTFGSGANTFTIDFVNIGNAGNADDATGVSYTADGGLYGSGTNFGLGGVPYAYRMGTYEISQDAITKATAGGLASVVAGLHTGNEPAANMTWFEAAAFVNWLNNQRTPGLKAYNLTGVSSLTPWASVDAWQAGGENLYRHKDAYYFLPSEDEWYKAAHHQNTGVNADYWDYATGSNTAPREVASGTTAGTVVYNGQAAPADVNLAGGLSAYGTMGQNGNVEEWQESALDGTNTSLSQFRVIRGGDWGISAGGLLSLHRMGCPPASSGPSQGFRVASVPEPSSTVLMCSAGLLAIARRRRRAALWTVSGAAGAKANS